MTTETTYQTRMAQRAARRAAEKKCRKTITKLAVFAAVLVLAVGFVLPRIGAALLGGQSPQGEAPLIEPQPKEPEIVSLDIRCAGDVMAHKSQVDSYYNKETDSYDFSSWFSSVSAYLQEADLAIANFETTFTGQAPYTGYPAFNAPDSLVDAVKGMGVDVANFSNNHMLDKGISGLKRSVEYMRSTGMVVSGARVSEDEPRYALIDVKGIKVGIVSYCYETPRSGGKRTMQANPMSSEALALTNTFGYEDNEGDLQNIAAQMQQARDAGAKLVICYMHWGEEYEFGANNWQKKMAGRLAELGADLIFGSHPHVPEEIEILELQTETGIKKVPVFYSLGNFVSNQRSETLGAGQNGKGGMYRTEEGEIGCVRISYCLDDDSFTVDSVSYIPLWVDRISLSGGKYEYGVIPLLGDYRSDPMLVRSGHADRADKALDHMNGLIGPEYLYGI